MTPISYDNALQYIHSLFRFGMKPGLERTRELLRRLGDPHRAGFRVVHVTGTNGKGSVCAMVAAGLTAAGYRTGLYISPFLEDWRERIQLDGAPIPAADVADLVAEVRPHVEAMVADGFEQPTEFEVTTAIAFLYYARRRADWVVLEVGLGGRYDATNVVEAPVVTAITNVSLDHTSVLGSTHARIAWDKAGILKPGVPCVTAVDHPAALAVIREVAGTVGAPLVWLRPPAAPVAAGLDGQVMDLTGEWRTAAGPGDQPGSYPGLRIGLLGRHQLANAAVAVACLELCGVPPAAIRAGLQAARWPGRFEILAGGSGEPMVILDVAHNPAGAKALAQTVRELLGGRRTVLVLGMLADKKVRAVLRPILPLATAVVTTTPEHAPRTPLGAAELAALVEQALTAAGRSPAVPVRPEPDPGLAVERALALCRAGFGDVVLVTGSFYVVGPVRTHLRHRVART